LKIAHNYFINFAFFFLILLLICNESFSQSLVRAGLRSSVYGFDSFPDSTWWYNVTSDMASKFDANPESAVIWILGNTTNNGCYLNFPNPNPDSSYSDIYFAWDDKDFNESFLDNFDNNGVKVWLQVEPGFADVSTLIDLVFTQYGHHSSIVGFGVDVEWYKTSSDNNNEGVAVTDEEVESWVNKIRSYNENYQLFTKHWLISKMPPTYRDGMVFVDDSQIFSDMNSMMNEFEDWGKAFAPAKVAFQYGYESDKIWWESLSDPPKEIGDEILRRCPNTSDLYWVDFTAHDIWPENFVPTSIKNDNGTVPKKILLNQNYPNPFNPDTIIRFSIPSIKNSVPVKTQLKVYDTLGKEIATLIDEDMHQGIYEVNFTAENLTSGIYYYKLQAGNIIETKKMIYLK